tara:strand:+ start:322 stop:1299 length:978 start_codon:yes stop_codon:yes gene_type:complete
MITRPGYRQGDLIIDDPDKIPNIKNKRRGIGNRTITRPGAKQQSGFSRAVIFNRLSVVDSDNAGVVELGEKTLAKLFEVKVPDITDVKWIAEKNRLIAKYMALYGMTKDEAEAEVQVNKPLGRAQRTITKQENIAQSNLSTGQKIDELAEEVAQGRAEGKTDRTLIMRQLAQTIQGVRALGMMTKKELDTLRGLAIRANIPADHKSFGLNTVFVDKDFYDRNSGDINLLFVGKYTQFERKGGVASNDYNINQLVPDFSKKNASGMPAKTISQMYRSLSRKTITDIRYLDLSRGGLIDHKQLVLIAASAPNGINNPMFNISIKPTP